MLLRIKHKCRRNTSIRLITEHDRMQYGLCWQWDGIMWRELEVKFISGRVREEVMMRGER